MTPRVLYQWTEEIAIALPCLNSWQVANVALFSHSVIEAESSQQMAIARKAVCGEQVTSAERRLRRFIANATFPLAEFFVAWTGWMVSRMDGAALTLLVDETKLSDRLAIMMVGVAFEGRCIPLAWCCYVANDAAAYPEAGQVELIMGLLRLVKQGIPAHYRVLLLADRGIGTSPELCRKVDELGWYYLFRVTKQSKIITDEGDFTIYQQVQAGQTWAASGLIFKQRGRIPAHARAIWSTGYNEPWALVSNDPDISGYEYAQRNWQEQGFRDLKSNGWQWSRSQVRCPERMERLLVILVVAYGWVLGLGSYAVHGQRARSLVRTANDTLRRQWSYFKEGLRLFTEYLLRQDIYLTPCFVSDHRF